MQCLQRNTFTNDRGTVGTTTQEKYIQLGEAQKMTHPQLTPGPNQRERTLGLGPPLMFCQERTLGSSRNVK